MIQKQSLKNKINRTLFFLLIYALTHNTMYSQSEEKSNYTPNILYASFKDFDDLEIKYDNDSKSYTCNNTELKEIFRKFEVTKIDRYAPNVSGHKLEKIYVIECNGDEYELLMILENYTNIFDYVERVPIAQVEGYYPNDYDVDDLWHLEKIQAPQAWEIITNPTLIPIGITDNGYDTTHVDLVDNISHMDGDVWYLPTRHPSHHGTNGRW